MKQRGEICIMRERKVTDYITDALFELLKEKKLEQITTTDIIKKAGVCRSSFYRNFYLPEDVIRQYGSALFDEINRNITIAPEGIREHIYTVNALFWHHREHLILLENRGLFHLLEGPILENCVLQFQRLGIPNNRYHTAYYAGATTHLIRAWIHNGFEESPEEMSEIICNMLCSRLTEDGRMLLPRCP